MTLVWTARAERDLRDLIDYIARDSVSAAINVEDRVPDAVVGLIEYPRKGRVGQTPSTRELPVRRTSLLVIYSLTDADVQILHVRHMGRRPFAGDEA